MANSSEGKVVGLRIRDVKIQDTRYGQLIRGQSYGAPNQRCQDSRHEIRPTYQRAKFTHALCMYARALEARQN